MHPFRDPGWPTRIGPSPHSRISPPQYPSLLSVYPTPHRATIDRRRRVGRFRLQPQDKDAPPEYVDRPPCLGRSTWSEVLCPECRPVTTEECPRIAPASVYGSVTFAFITVATVCALVGTPILHEGRIHWISGGIANCMDAKTGEPMTVAEPLRRQNSKRTDPSFAAETSI